MLLKHAKIAGTVTGAAAMAVLLLGGAGDLQAQRGAVTAALGPSIPRGAAGDRYDIGVAGRLSFEVQTGTRLAFRLDAEWSQMGGGDPALYPEDLLIYGGSLNALWRFESERTTPFLLVGAGGYRLQREGEGPSVYGITPAVQAGLGLEVRVWPPASLVLEGRAAAHLTDYASTEFTPSVFWPVTAGLRWELPD